MMRLFRRRTAPPTTPAPPSGTVRQLCAATTLAGKPCSLPAAPGSDRCRLHRTATRPPEPRPA